MECLLTIGQHLLIECTGKQAHLDQDHLESLLLKAAQAGGANVLSSHFHPFGENLGITGVLILAESHITVHTWPELGYAAYDIFMCGDCRPDLAAKVISDADSSAKISIKSYTRKQPTETINQNTFQPETNQKEIL
jgi:S-adenosylmethionine decarboxylase